jgi:hypothetical protein
MDVKNHTRRNKELIQRDYTFVPFVYVWFAHPCPTHIITYVFLLYCCFQRYMSSTALVVALNAKVKPLREHPTWTNDDSD